MEVRDDCRYIFINGPLTGSELTSRKPIQIMQSRLFRIILFSALGIVVAALFAWQYGLLSPTGRGTGNGVAAIGGPFTLVDQNGKTRTDRDFRGKLMLVYFGYTYCPDVCPTALQVMSVALDLLGKDAKEVVPIFITIDPERDTVPVMRDYVKNFHPGMVGLTGSPAAIRQAAKAYRVYYRKAESGSGGGAGTKDYLMDHSSVVLLMDREGRYLTHFSHQTQSEEMAAEIRTHL